jgi:hypothetical protein|tara:strand:+ start:603 stop:851 length:249 start_codon:yes stop_codon:yes gene_type:complete
MRTVETASVLGHETHLQQSDSSSLRVVGINSEQVSRTSTDESDEVINDSGSDCDQHVKKSNSHQDRCSSPRNGGAFAKERTQ